MGASALGHDERGARWLDGRTEVVFLGLCHKFLQNEAAWPSVSWKLSSKRMLAPPPQAPPLPGIGYEALLVVQTCQGPSPDACLQGCVGPRPRGPADHGAGQMPT